MNRVYLRQQLLFNEWPKDKSVAIAWNWIYKQTPDTNNANKYYKQFMKSETKKLVKILKQITNNQKL